jgi:hypothetical protein
MQTVSLDESLKIKIDRLFEDLELEAAEAARSPRLRTPLQARDIDGFFQLTSEVVKLQQMQEGVQKPVLFTEEFPDQEDNLDKEIITFLIKDRKPGAFEQVPVGTAMGANRNRARRYMFREAIDDPNNSGMKIHMYGLEFDNLVEFNIWASKNRTANRRALWFEDLMEQWRWYFLASGIKKLDYIQRNADEHLAPDNKKIVCRTLSYYVRTEKIITISEAALRSLIVE